MTVSFECRTRSSRSPAELFDLARDIGVHTASQAAAGERAVGGVVTGLIGPGEEVTWRARHFGLPFSLTSRVTAFDAPHRFVDEQVRGPFARFRHEHLFEADGAGCVMTDRIEFTAPLGPLGRLVEHTVLARHLRRLIEERGRFLAGSA
ncbi:SRPBCC family protein [Rathayibacter sp. SD072]|uniref:SRPBCC family protein n=1 Tax=Rathayibacter sp. SD072 TaxID=2781731 RepID=UPI001A970929|nr:SRPBCC family protein [Rathayibacter sp. SD072]MBO0984385.1 SRPBCC family protein [Rathayibacter sp. SD072]